MEWILQPNCNNRRPQDYGSVSQELMGSEATKERVTAVLSKSKLLAYFRFTVHPLTSCGL